MQWFECWADIFGVGTGIVGLLISLATWWTADTVRKALASERQRSDLRQRLRELSLARRLIQKLLNGRAKRLQGKECDRLRLLLVKVLAAIDFTHTERTLIELTIQLLAEAPLQRNDANLQELKKVQTSLQGLRQKLLKQVQR